MSTYRVKAGDTLSHIGVRVGVNWREIASHNNIKAPYTIYTGQVLKIPTETSPANDDQANDNVTVTTGGGILDKIIGVALLWGIFKVLMKVF